MQQFGSYTCINISKHAYFFPVNSFFLQILLDPISFNLHFLLISILLENPTCLHEKQLPYTQQNNDKHLTPQKEKISFGNWSFVASFHCAWVSLAGLKYLNIPPYFFQAGNH